MGAFMTLILLDRCQGGSCSFFNAMHFSVTGDSHHGRRSDAHLIGEHFALENQCTLNYAGAKFRKLSAVTL